MTVRNASGTNARGTYVIEPGTLRTHKDGKGFRKTASGLVPTIPARAREDGSGQPCVRIYDIENIDPATTQIRRLTPVECERLQSFRDGWTSAGITPQVEVEPISDTQRYKTLGNAVTVNVIRDIMLKLL